MRYERGHRVGEIRSIMFLSDTEFRNISKPEIIPQLDQMRELKAQ